MKTLSFDSLAFQIVFDPLKLFIVLVQFLIVHLLPVQYLSLYKFSSHCHGHWIDVNKNLFVLLDCVWLGLDD